MLLGLVMWPSPSPSPRPLHSNLRTLGRMSTRCGINSAVRGEIKFVSYIPLGYTNLILIQVPLYAPAPCPSSKRHRTAGKECRGAVR